MQCTVIGRIFFAGELEMLVSESLRRVYDKEGARLISQHADSLE